ncbi:MULTISPECIES: type II secretion system protein GspM [unclassified Bradyrhizobium]|uniref:type II secretion system protein GspM n=1 Tax=unclassified Bradyrhizobium TaxID=2631580 RepID=UPI0028E5A4E5|nr:MULTISPECIES: type II secretion system protein GspM [unclassified Bradyrhizobium]
MNQNATLAKVLARPVPAAITYLGVMLAFLVVIASSATDVLGRRANVAATAAMLEQLDGHKPALARRTGAEGTPPSGSPFLEGATVTVAGAALLQRVTGAITKLGGNVQSSQIDLQGTQSKTGFITMIASCDIDQVGLQRLLYDIEAGMPFLFVDQLVVQAPTNVAEAGDSKLRILLTVSGQWQGAK